MGQYTYDAVMAKPDFDYAMAHAALVNNTASSIQKSGVEPKDMLLSWKKSADGQTVKLEFAFNTQESLDCLFLRMRETHRCVNGVLCNMR